MALIFNWDLKILFFFVILAELSRAFVLFSYDNNYNNDYDNIDNGIKDDNALDADNNDVNAENDRHHNGDDYDDEEFCIDDDNNNYGRNCGGTFFHWV